VRIEGDEIEGAMAERLAALQLERDERAGGSSVTESRLRSDRLRRLQSVPPCEFIARFDRVRDGCHLRLRHPGPLELTPPADEFVVAQAIGSLLDGLAWLHRHGVTHGAVGPLALVEGPTGGRLSLAGACSNTGAATPADDVYAAAALAFTLLFGEPPSPDAARDARLSDCASPAVARAIREGLDPVADRRPTARSLAALVRGEQWVPLADATEKEPLLGRLRTSVLNATHAVDRRWAGVAGGAVAMLLFVGGLTAAHRSEPTSPAAADPITEFLPPDERPPAAVARRAPTTMVVVAPPTATVAPTTAAAATTAPEVSVLSAAAETPPAPTTAAPPPRPAPPPPTTAAPPPPPPPPPPPTAPTTTRAAVAPTTRAATTTTRATTTTTRPTSGKGKKGKGGDANDASDANESLLGALIGILLG
jgi:hypothetical protein